MFKIKNENRFTLFLVLLFSLTITITIVYLNSTHHILNENYRDVFYYLIQSLRFSGTDISGYAFVNYLPPVIPFLTSILFRLGFVSTSSIFIVSGMFFIFGILATFYILRLRFSNLYSFLGAFVYATLFMNISWVGNGTLDIAFISILLWTLYFFIKGIENNQKYFYIAFPLGVLCFFTKYPGGLIFPLMFLYFMAKTNFFTNFKKYYKNIIGGLISGFLCLIPFVGYFLLNNIPFGFLNQAQDISSTSSLTASHRGHLVGNDLFFYIKGLVYYISSTDYFIGIIILAIFFIGLILLILSFKNFLKKSYDCQRKVQVFKWKISLKAVYFTLAVSVLMIILSFLTASLFSFLYSEALLFIGLYLFAYSYSKINLKYSSSAALSITMIGLFLSYLVFFSSHLVKADRYFTSMAPGFVFLLTLSVEFLLSKVKTRKFNLKYLIIGLIMCLMIFSSIHYLITIQDESAAVDEKNTTEWILGKKGIVASERGPTYTWYLQREVIFIKDPLSNAKLNNKLLGGNVTYYISFDDVNLSSYSPIKEFGEVTVFKKN